MITLERIIIDALAVGGSIYRCVQGLVFYYDGITLDLRFVERYFKYKIRGSILFSDEAHEETFVMVCCVSLTKQRCFRRL